MQRGGMTRGLWVVVCAAALAPVVCAAALVLVAYAAPREVATVDYGVAASPRYDRVYKCDLVERLPEPPELVIFGGSRAQRFEPTVAAELTGLPAFNFAVQNSRPEDVYAMARHLFWRAPGVKLRCFWALQATTFADAPLHPGLLAERRLSRFLPEHLVAEQRTISVSGEGRELSPDDRFTARGDLAYNAYDARLERGVSFAHTLAGYLSSLVPRAGAPDSYDSTRAKKYFERTLQLFNLHDVEPVLVIMPYHPTALAAFRAVGWGAKEQALKTYLTSLRGTYHFHLLDYTDIVSFHGSEDAFYDGAHVTAANARRILKQAVKDVPDAQR